MDERTIERTEWKPRDNIAEELVEQAEVLLDLFDSHDAIKKSHQAAYAIRRKQLLKAIEEAKGIKQFKYRYIVRGGEGQVTVESDNRKDIEVFRTFFRRSIIKALEGTT